MDFPIAKDTRESQNKMIELVCLSVNFGSKIASKNDLESLDKKAVMHIIKA